MLNNLSAEMARNQIDNKTIATHLGISRKSVDNKINETADFTYDEMSKIQELFFGYTIEYLFHSDTDYAY